MVMFSRNQNSKTVPVGEATDGPAAGFLGSFEMSYKAQVEASSLLGQRAMFEEMVDERNRILSERGELDTFDLGRGKEADDPNAYSENRKRDSAQYDRIMSALSPGGSWAREFFNPGETEEMRQRIHENDTKIVKLREKYADSRALIKTDAEIYESIRQRVQETEYRDQTTPRTFAGQIGSLAGGAVASMDPRTDPINFATLGVGGIGKTVLTRLLFQGGSQAAVEGANQVLAVQENRARMGLSSGVADAAMRVGMTAAAGVVFQGIGEGLYAGAKRWFPDAGPPPPDPTPEAPLLLTYQPRDGGPPRQRPMRPVEVLEMNINRMQAEQRAEMYWAQTPMGAARFESDMRFVDAETGRWDGPSFVEVKAPTDTALPRPAGNPEINVPAYVKEGLTKGSIDALARDVDPKLFTVFDRISGEANTLREWLVKMRPDAKAIDDGLSGLNNQIDELKAQASNANARKRKTLNAQIEELQAKRDVAREQATKTDTPSMAAVRRKLIELDQQMRDMAPLVTRAYTRARGEWDMDAGGREAVERMIREGRNTLEETELKSSYEDAKLAYDRDLADRAPIMKQVDQVTEQMPPNADAADYAKAIIKQNMKLMEDAANDLLSKIGMLVKEGEETVIVNGKTLDLDDVIEVPLVYGDGSQKLTVREVLEDLRDAKEDVEAMKICSIA